MLSVKGWLAIESRDTILGFLVTEVCGYLDTHWKSCEHMFPEIIAARLNLSAVNLLLSLMYSYCS